MMSSVLLRKIGDASVPVIGFGAMGTSFCYDAVGSEEERFKASSQAVTGIWESSPCFSRSLRLPTRRDAHSGEPDIYFGSEDLIGKWY